MRFVAPNAVPRMKRNFDAALNRMFFFDDQTAQSELTFSNWTQLVPKTRAGAYIFESGNWRTGHVQGQTADKYFPANLGALVDTESTQAFSTNATPVPPPLVSTDMWDFLTLEVTERDYTTAPLGVLPKRLYGFGGNKFSAPDTRMLFAMKAKVIGTAVAAKLTSAFTTSNTFYSTGGGYNTWWIQRSGICAVTQIKMSSAGLGGTKTAVAHNWASILDPFFAHLPVDASPVGQLMVMERTEHYRQQQIYAAGSGSGPVGYYQYYNYRNLTAGGMENAAFDESTVKGMYYPISGTAETPNISWGAMLVRWGLERIFVKLDSSDITARTVTPGQSVQIAAQKTFNVPIIDKQIFLM